MNNEIVFQNDHVTDLIKSHNCVEAQNLISLLAKTIINPTQTRLDLANKDFIFAVDHCFLVSGQGTVMTGTVLAGSTSVNQVRKIICLLNYGLRTFMIFLYM